MLPLARAFNHSSPRIVANAQHLRRLSNHFRPPAISSLYNYMQTLDILNHTVAYENVKYTSIKMAFLTDHFSKFAILFEESLMIFFCAVYVDGSATMQRNARSDFSLLCAYFSLDDIFLI